MRVMLAEVAETWIKQPRWWTDQLVKRPNRCQISTPTDLRFRYRRRGSRGVVEFAVASALSVAGTSPTAPRAAITRRCRWRAIQVTFERCRGWFVMPKLLFNNNIHRRLTISHSRSFNHQHKLLERSHLWVLFPSARRQRPLLPSAWLSSSPSSFSFSSFCSSFSSLLFFFYLKLD